MQKYIIFIVSCSNRFNFYVLSEMAMHIDEGTIFFLTNMNKIFWLISPNLEHYYSLIKTRQGAVMFRSKTKKVD
jgi:hypothetical protein